MVIYQRWSSVVLDLGLQTGPGVCVRGEREKDRKKESEIERVESERQREKEKEESRWRPYQERRNDEQALGTAKLLRG